MSYNELLKEFKNIYGRDPYNNKEFYDFADCFGEIK